MQLYSIEDAEKLKVYYCGVLWFVGGEIKQPPIENGKYAILFTGTVKGQKYRNEDICNIAAALNFILPEKVLKEDTCK